MNLKDNFHTSVHTFASSMLNANIGQAFSAALALTMQTCRSNDKKAF